jgi:hypothetical protein
MNKLLVTKAQKRLSSWSKFKCNNKLQSYPVLFGVVQGRGMSTVYVVMRSPLFLVSISRMINERIQSFDLVRQAKIIDHRGTDI